MNPNLEFARPLWIGGGIRWDTLVIVGTAIRGAAKVVLDGPIRIELENLANAVAAELSKRPAPPDPECDLI